MSDLYPNGIRPVWIASYPRSGNTFLRIILEKIFQQPTYSIYRVEGDNFADPSADALGAAPFLPQNWRHLLTDRPNAQRLLLKTHDVPENAAPAIYLVRDGRAAVDSYFHYHQRFAFDQPSLTAVIAGACQFGSWSEHYLSWRPRTRPNTLFLRYEDLVGKPAEIIPKLAEFLRLEPHKGELPTFDELKSKSPAFFRRGASRTFLTEWTSEQLTLFNACHGPVMDELTYEMTAANESTSGITLELARTAARSHQLYLKNLKEVGAAAASQQQLQAEITQLKQQVGHLSHQLKELSGRLAQNEKVLLPLIRNPWVRLGKTFHVVPKGPHANGG